MKVGWERKKLKDIAEYSIGLTYSPNDVSKKGIVVLRSSNIQDGKIDLSDIVRVKKTVNQNLIVKSGDILMCSRNGSKRLVGKTATIPELGEEMTFGTFMTIIRSPYNRFLSWFFISDEFRKQISGGENTMINQVTKYMLDEIEVSLPPLAEQQRLVRILDEAFEGIAIAKANAEKNLQNARALFESYLQAVFSQRGEGWEEKRLGDVGKTQYGLSEPMNEESKGYKIFRMGELQGGRLIDTGRMKFADISQAEFEKYRLQSGDILFNRTNSFELVGKTGIFDLPGDYCFASYLVRVLLNRDIMLPAFLNYFMNSERFQDSMKRKASKSINQANINATILANESVCFPKSLKEQTTIVTRLDSLQTETQRLASIYQRKLAALEALKKSLLHQAFNGEL